MSDVVTVVVDGTRLTARVQCDPSGRVVAARDIATGDPVPALVDPAGDVLAALRAALHAPADDEPTPESLAAIEAEWPLIEAELDELDCVIRIISNNRDPDEMDLRRYRRAQRRVLREMRALLSHEADRIGVA